MSSLPSATAHDHRIHPTGMINDQWVFLTYSHCPLEHKEDFEESLKWMLLRNSLKCDGYYGFREHHKEHGPQYRVLVDLGRTVNWTLQEAREAFVMMGGDSYAHITSLHCPVNTTQETFISRSADFCKRYGGDKCFGRHPRPTAIGRTAEKRKQLELGIPRAVRTTLAMAGAASQSGLDRSSDHAASAHHHGHIDLARFRIPPEIRRWEYQNLTTPPRGRPYSLLIVGDPQTGKTSLAWYIASQYGEVFEFDSKQGFREYQRSYRCAIFHGFKKHFTFWKNVMGCKVKWRGRVGRQANRLLDWGIPSIITCTYEDDPRKWGECYRNYIKINCVVSEVPSGSSLYANTEKPVETARD